MHMYIPNFICFHLCLFMFLYLPCYNVAKSSYVTNFWLTLLFWRWKILPNFLLCYQQVYDPRQLEYYNINWLWLCLLKLTAAKLNRFSMKFLAYLRAKVILYHSYCLLNLDTKCGVADGGWCRKRVEFGFTMNDI